MMCVFEALDQLVARHIDRIRSGIYQDWFRCVEQRRPELIYQVLWSAAVYESGNEYEYECQATAKNPPARFRMHWNGASWTLATIRRHQQRNSVRLSMGKNQHVPISSRTCRPRFSCFGRCSVIRSRAYFNSNRKSASLSDVILRKPFPYLGSARPHNWVFIGVVIYGATKHLRANDPLFEAVQVSVKALADDVLQELLGLLAGAKRSTS